MRLGVKRENIMLGDTKGVVYNGRTEGMNPYKERFAQETKLRTLAEAVEGCGRAVGLSVKGAITQEMVRSMAAQADRVRDGESRSGDHLRRRKGSAQRHYDRDRPLGLSELGE